MLELMLLLLLVLPLYIFVIVIFFKLKPIIKMTELIENLFTDQVDTPSPLDRKRDVLKQNLSQINKGKKQWTFEMIDKASEKQVNGLLKKIQPAKPAPCKKDLLSKMTGVDNFQNMMNDINSNFLIQNSTSELIGNVTGKLPSFTGNSLMEVIASFVYEKCKPWLSDYSLILTILYHLDWEKFAEIAEQRQILKMLKNQQDKSEDDIFPEINNDRGESSQTFDETK